MNGKVVVREGESIPQALRRLSGIVRHATKRQFSRTRPGAYEKPSYLRRQKQALRNRNSRAGGGITVYIGLAQLFDNQRPFRG